MNTIMEADKFVSLAMIGSVDSGKSTTIGCLISGKLDNGDGLTRKIVAVHNHEIETGRTSAISDRSIKLNITEKIPIDKESTELKDVSYRKIITIYDMCGHEGYLKTTLFGLLGTFPDYLILSIASNRGPLKMTREHLGIAMCLERPFFGLFTKMDLLLNNTDGSLNKDVFDTNMSSTIKTIRRTQKKGKLLNNLDDFKLYLDYINASDSNKLLLQDKWNTRKQKISDEFNQCLEYMRKNDKYDTVPILCTSNKTGYCLDILVDCVTKLQQCTKWIVTDQNSIFYIDSVFNVIGVGIVISGTLKGNTINKGDKISLGPFDGSYYTCRIRSIHNNIKEEINSLHNSEKGCLAIKFESNINKLDLRPRKGMVALNYIKNETIRNEIFIKYTCWQFEADITILHHPTTIKAGYCATIQFNTTRQIAKITKIVSKSGDILRQGYKGKVIFHFLSCPAFIEIGNTFFFREGTTKGFGIITNPISEKDPSLILNKRQKKCNLKFI